MAKKADKPKPTEDDELIKKIDKMLNIKEPAESYAAPASLADIKLQPVDGEPATTVASEPEAKQEEPAKEPPDPTSQLDDPIVDKAVKDILIADSDRLLEAEAPAAETAAVSAKVHSTATQWLWLLAVLLALVLAAAYLVLHPTKLSL